VQKQDGRVVALSNFPIKNIDTVNIDRFVKNLLAHMVLFN
jgi:hypothetical protein